MTRKINELMHAGVESHAPNAPILTIAKTMKDKDVGAVPILDKGQIIGIVTDRDIAVRALAGGRDISTLTARDVMTQDVACCQDNDTAADAERIMEDRQVRRLPVLDRNKKVVGMISLGDISHAGSGALSAKLVRAVSAHHA